jgi:hypothetical protein
MPTDANNDIQYLDDGGHSHRFYKDGADGFPEKTRIVGMQKTSGK